MEPVNRSIGLDFKKTLIKWYEHNLKQPGRMPLVLIALSLLMTLIFDWKSSFTKAPTETPPPKTKTAPTIDTHIPSGYSLVPIDLQNAESLSSLMEGFAIVDLFETQEGQKARKVAHHVRLLRAPQDPSQFAVLVQAEQVKKIMGFQTALFASLQNPNQKPLPTTTKVIPKSRIYLEPTYEVLEEKDHQ